MVKRKKFGEEKISCNFLNVAKFFKFGGLQLSGKTISWVKIFLVGIILDENFLSGNCQDESYPVWKFFEWKFSKWKLLLVGIFLGGNFLHGKFPVEVIRMAIF